jgi:hypothetical protein
MKTASWIILLVTGALTLLFGLVSLGRAYLSPQDRIGPATLTELAQGRPEVATAMHGRRATAAAFAAGFATLFLAIVLGPYRRGDRWAWWALAAGTLVVAVSILLRIPLLGTSLGAATGAIQLAVVGLGLALGAGRLRGSSSPS